MSKAIAKGVRLVKGDINGLSINNLFLVVELKSAKSKFGDNHGIFTGERPVDVALTDRLMSLDFTKTLELDLELEGLANGKGDVIDTVVDFKVLAQLEYKPVSVPSVAAPKV